MALNTFEEILKVEELLKIREEYLNDVSLKAEIINEGLRNRLNTALGLQTTLLGRIESNPPDFSEVYLREQDANDSFKQKYKINKDKKAFVIPIKDFLNELKLALRNNLKNEIDKLQTEYEKINKYCSENIKQKNEKEIIEEEK